MLRLPSSSTLFPYTTLFRSVRGDSPRDVVMLRIDLVRRFRRGVQRPATEIRDLRARTQVPYLRSEEHTSELQSRRDLVCRLLLEKQKFATARCASSRLK